MKILVFFTIILLVAPSWAAKSGADKEIGWTIRKTKNGLVKVPKKQIFIFDGSELGADVDKPMQSTLGSRKAPPRRSLIPVRQNFKSEMMESVGYPASNRD